MALVGVLPFIAEQLAAITRTWAFASGRATPPPGALALVVVAMANRVFEALRERKAAEWPRYEGAFETLFTPGNAALFHQISITMSRVMTPLLTAVLQEGINQGSFRITDAHAVAEMIVHLEGSMHSVLVSAAEVRRSVGGIR